MNANVLNKLVPLASLFGTMGLLGACASSEKDPEGTGATSGLGGAGGSGGQAGSGGRAGSGPAGSGGTAGSDTAGSGAGGIAGSGGSAGLDCGTPGEPVNPVIWSSDGGDGGAAGEAGAGGAENFVCFPGVVCVSPAVPTPGMSFVNHAFASMGASSAGVPIVTNESGVPNLKISYPEPGKVCMSGDDQATLALWLRTDQLWDGVHLPASSAAGDDLFHAGELGITAMSFTIETPPTTGVSLWILAFPPPCLDFVQADAEKDGNPVVITSTGTTTTLSFATDFTVAFDTNAIAGVNFSVGPGAYDYCVTNLKFLDVNGREVTP